MTKVNVPSTGPGVWDGSVRLKLLALPTFAYAFLLQLLQAGFAPVRAWLLRTYWQRTGWHRRPVKAPLYRLRSALSGHRPEHPPTGGSQAAPGLSQPPAW